MWNSCNNAHKGRQRWLPFLHYSKTAFQKRKKQIDLSNRHGDILEKYCHRRSIKPVSLLGFSINRYLETVSEFLIRTKQVPSKCSLTWPSLKKKKLISHRTPLVWSLDNSDRLSAIPYFLCTNHWVSGRRAMRAARPRRDESWIEAAGSEVTQIGPNRNSRLGPDQGLFQFDKGLLTWQACKNRAISIPKAMPLGLMFPAAYRC